MLNRENLEQFTKSKQTDIENVLREYCQHLFLSYLYQLPTSERMLFKGGTALRIIFGSPRFSEDLDFTGMGIRQKEVEELFADTLAEIEKTGIKVDINEAKETTGGYLGIAVFSIYGQEIEIRIEVSLRNIRRLKGTRAVIQSDYLPTYTLVHLPIEDIIDGKFAALTSRQKPRDFYDYYFLLSGNFPYARRKKFLEETLKLLKQTRINFKTELKKFLPASHSMLFLYFYTIQFF